MNYPPFFFLVKCFETSPTAALTYILLWRNRVNSSVSFSKDLVEEQFLMHPSEFETHLLLLEQACLLNFSRTTDAFEITLNENSRSNEELKLC